jgi:epoxyqueuosine reductase
MVAMCYGNKPRVQVPKVPTLQSVNCPLNSTDSLHVGHPITASIALFAQYNYYREAVKRLQGLAKQLRKTCGGTRGQFQIICNSPVPEKPLAERCGLGVMGRNGLLLTKEAGSLVVLAGMSLPYTLSADPPLDWKPCAECPAPCVKACPTGAQSGAANCGSFPVLEKCIQWYASGHGDAVPPEVAAQWGRRFYGCTACVDACVQNRRPMPGVETEEGPLPPVVDCREILALSDEQIKARFHGTAMGLSWLTPAALRRNARLSASATSSC